MIYQKRENMLKEKIKCKCIKSYVRNDNFISVVIKENTTLELISESDLFIIEYDKGPMPLEIRLTEEEYKKHFKTFNEIRNDRIELILNSFN